MSENHQARGRLKFDVSLAKLSRPGTHFYHFKTYKPPEMLTSTAQDAQTDMKVTLTPQQEARKRYEERNLDQRRKKARERMARRRAQDSEREREKQKMYEEIHREERRYEEDRRRSLRYIEKHGAKSFHCYLKRRNGRLQRPEDYAENK
ncbi:hypothetical protein F5880DRAFT_1616769 [Lentinula raphanica]|nr:hypothetical protein F5880DRAFT_1616769 [Lentinula raphanica]